MKGDFLERKMSITAKPLEDMIRELPPDVHAEVRDLVEFLLTRKKRKKITGSSRIGRVLYGISVKNIMA